MIAGHFGLAAAVKSQAKQVPLWSLMLATVWLDVIFVPLLITGVETIGPAPGLAPGYGANIIHADYTHSLVGALVLSATFGMVSAFVWGRQSGLILAGVSFSHWLLDLLFHHADMPILPGNAGNLPRVGLGLWQYPAVALSLELAIVLLGGFLYWRAAMQTAAGAGSGERRSTALLSSALVLVGGVAILFLDATGVLG